MTMTPQAGPTGTPAPRPPAGGGGSPSVATIDPVKLLKKYQWVLVASVIIGAVLGAASHFILLRVAPKYVSEVTFQITPPQESLGEIFPEGTRSDALDRFMLTQKENMTSETMLTRLAQDPRLPFEAPLWAKQYTQGGQLNPVEAVEGLEEIISARVLTGTEYINLVVKWRNPDDVTALAKLAKEAYLGDLKRSTNVQVEGQSQVINDTIQGIEEEIRDLNDQRARLLKEQSVDSLDNKSTALGQRQTLVLSQLADADQTVMILTSRLSDLEKMRNSEAGITYTDTQRAAANQDPLVMNQRQQLKMLETELQSLRERGIKSTHREYKRIQAQIDSTSQKLTDMTEETLSRNFDAEYDQFESELRSYQYQHAQFSEDAEELRTELSDLNKTLAELDELDRRAKELITAQQDKKSTLDDLTMRASLRNASRVQVVGPERRPNQPAFPKIIMMVPAGVFLFTGLVGGLLFLREILDQRVKGPSDIALLPRTRVLGMIPAVDEEDGRSQKTERIFVESPSSVVAEHYRQLRTTVIKQMQRHQHRSLVVVGGMPGSGASSVVSNLGLACAAMDLNVLLIDGNFRRPALHRLFELNDGPGVADVLAGLVPFDDAIQHAPGVAHLDVLTVGTAENRVYERLGGHQMGELLGSTDGKYDLVLIDVAPLMVSGDGMAVANRADASMLVVRAFGEKRGMVARLRNELGDCRAEMLGVLINAVRSAAGGYMRQNIRASRAYHTPGMKVGESIDHEPVKS
jgi:polysaccharide biosynthesis transport protein